MSRERERLDEIAKRAKRELGDGGDGVAASHNNCLMRSSGSMLKSAAATTTKSLNTISPCAACKLLRRRCAQECPFFPYFSPHEPHKFASVHKVFGASNVSKMLLEVAESQRADAANSLVYEANVRLRDPVYGCMGAILALQQQVQNLQSQLNSVRAQIIKYRYTEEAAAATSTMNIIPNSTTSAGGGSTVVTVAATPSPATVPSHHQPPRLAEIPPSSDSSSSSMFTQSMTSATDFTTISCENMAYFG